MIRFGMIALIFLGFWSLAWAQQAQTPSTPVSSSPVAPPSGSPSKLPPPLDPPSGVLDDGTSTGPSATDDLMEAPAEGLSARDPFRLPEELIIKIRQKNAALITASSGGIDPAVEAIRRFPLGSYQLVGIIWDVKKPKAMFMDVSKSIHVVQVNDFIGNAKGVITSIQSGAVTVLEGKIPQIIKLKK